jgi:hypothetical protein
MSEDQKISLPNSEKLGTVKPSSGIILQWDFVSDAVAYSIWKFNPTTRERVQVAKGLFSSYELKVTPEDIAARSIEIEMVAHAMDFRRDRGTGPMIIHFQVEKPNSAIESNRRNESK